MRLYRDPGNPGLISADRSFYDRVARASARKLLLDHVVPPRAGWAWPVKAGQVCRIVAVEGPQVGDFNVWNLDNPREHFWQARTRQLEGAHISAYARLWSCLPYLRPMLTVTRDSIPREPSANGGRCHDLLGSRCDPYLYKLADNREVDVTCHSNLTRAIAPYHLTELDVHDVLNWFQVTGLHPLHEGYFMEPSPAKKGDFVEFFAEIDILCAISTCPGGDLSVRPWGPERADPLPTCKPLGVEVYELDAELLQGWRPPQPVEIGSLFSPQTHQE